DADARDVVGPVARGQCPVPGDAVRETGIAQVLPGHVVEGLGPVGGAHAVDLHDDEAVVGQFLHAHHLVAAAVVAERPAGLGHAGIVRAGVDVLDYRVAPRGVVVAGPHHQAPDVGGPVAALGHEHLGRLPAGGQQARDVGALDPGHQRAVGAPQLHHRRHVHARIHHHEVAAVGR